MSNILVPTTLEQALEISELTPLSVSSVLLAANCKECMITLQKYLLT